MSKFYVGVDIIEDNQHYAVLNSPKFDSYDEADAWYRQLTLLDECEVSVAIYQEEDDGLVNSFVLF